MKDETTPINNENKFYSETYDSIKRLHDEYKEKYKTFFETLTQKNDEELKMLAFRLDFNEYYTDKLYQINDFDYYNISLGQSINIDEDLKHTYKPEGKDEGKLVSKDSINYEAKTRKTTTGATKIIKPSQDNIFRKTHDKNH